jgi:alkylhydroperoxidase/carboxymuconolactone decarboxylase family protein YurZ
LTEVFVASLFSIRASDHLNGDEEIVRHVKTDFQNSDISKKLKALLVIAGRVQREGKYVTPRDIGEARTAGATDIEIHDTVLIAAAFCLYNRYVDGLATWQPEDDGSYAQRAQKTARQGYVSVSEEYLPK